MALVLSFYTKEKIMKFDVLKRDRGSIGSFMWIVINAKDANEVFMSFGHKWEINAILSQEQMFKLLKGEK
jgi:hypothetical protein